MFLPCVRYVKLPLWRLCRKWAAESKHVAVHAIQTAAVCARVLFSAILTVEISGHFSHLNSEKFRKLKGLARFPNAQTLSLLLAR